MIRRIVNMMAPLLSISIAYAVEDDLTCATSFDLAYKKLHFEVAQPTTNLTFKPDLWTLGLGFSVAYRGFYTSIGMERTLQEGVDAGMNSNVVTIDHFKRNEDSVTLGYRLWRGWSAYLGYLKTEAERYSSITQLYASDAAIGPYLGISYSQILKTGTLSANMAYANMEGSFSRLSVATMTESDAESAGFTYALVWTSPWIANLNYRIGLKLNRYRNETVFAGGVRTNRQDYNSIFLGLINYF